MAATESITITDETGAQLSLSADGARIVASTSAGVRLFPEDRKALGAFLARHEGLAVQKPDPIKSGTIDRSKIIEAARILDVDPTDVETLTITPHLVTVESYRGVGAPLHRETRRIVNG